MESFELCEPTLETRPAIRVAGLCERYAYTDCSGIPAQWERFRPFLGQIPGVLPGATYGVCRPTDHPGELDYYAGVEVDTVAGVPDGLKAVHVPEQHYAVFVFSEHISAIQHAIQAIWQEWVPASGRKAAHGPMLERYSDAFDPVTGEGGFEIWLPVEP